MSKSEHGARVADKIRMNLAQVFEGQKFEVESEVHLGANEVFQTPFGNKGRHGYVLRNTETGHRIVVGRSILVRAAEEFGAVELPEELKTKRKRRTKAEMEAARAKVSQTDKPGSFSLGEAGQLGEW